MAQTKRISGVATDVFNDGSDTVVKLYQTEVVRWNSKRIVLNNGGYVTATTKRRMNQTSNEFNLEYSVYSKSGEMLVDYNGKTVAFEFGTATLER